MSFRFDFEEQEAQVLVDALAAQPYRAVAGVIQKLLSQVNEQRQAAEAVPADAKKVSK